MDNVIVTQHTVQRQVFCNTVVVADNADTVPPRIHDLDGAANNCLLGSRVCSMSASRGYFPGSTISTFIGILLIRSFFQRIFLLNGQQHDACRRRKGNDHNSQQRETISCLRKGLHLVRRNNRRGNRSGRRGCSGRRLRCGCRRGRGSFLTGCGFVYHLNEPFVSAHPFGIDIFADEQANILSACCTLNCTDSAISKPAGAASSVRV